MVLQWSSNFQNSSCYPSAALTSCCNHCDNCYNNIVNNQLINVEKQKKKMDWINVNKISIELPHICILWFTPRRQITVVRVCISKCPNYNRRSKDMVKQVKERAIPIFEIQHAVGVFLSPTLTSPVIIFSEPLQDKSDK